MLTFTTGDRLTHSLNGEGTVLRIGLGAKKSLIDVLFDEGSGVGQFIDAMSKNIVALNGAPVSPRLIKWRPTNYVAAANRDFSDDQLDFLRAHVSRITYRPHPYSFDRFVTDYEAVTGASCPMKQTNRHESAYSDCAEIYFDCYPPAGLFEFALKQQGEQWFTENVGLAWVLFRTGFSIGE